jgi:hypothetical protein
MVTKCSSWNSALNIAEWLAELMPNKTQWRQGPQVSILTDALNRLNAGLPTVVASEQEKGLGEWLAHFLHKAFTCEPVGDSLDFIQWLSPKIDSKEQLV